MELTHSRKLKRNETVAPTDEEKEKIEDGETVILENHDGSKTYKYEKTEGAE